MITGSGVHELAADCLKSACTQVVRNDGHLRLTVEGGVKEVANECTEVCQRGQRVVSMVIAAGISILSSLELYSKSFFAASKAA